MAPKRDTISADEIIERNKQKAESKSKFSDKDSEIFIKRIKEFYNNNIKELDKFEKSVSKAWKSFSKDLTKEWTDHLSKLENTSKKIVKVERTAEEERLHLIELYNRLKKTQHIQHLTEEQKRTERHIQNRVKMDKALYYIIDNNVSKATSKITSVGKILDKFLGGELGTVISKGVNFIINSGKNIVKMGIGLSRLIKSDVKVGNKSTIGNMETEKEKKKERIKVDQYQDETIKQNKKQHKEIKKGNDLQEAWWKWEKIQSFFRGLGDGLMKLIPFLFKWIPLIAGAYAFGKVLQIAINNLANKISEDADRVIGAIYKKTEQDQAKKQLAKGKAGQLGLDEIQRKGVEKEAQTALLKIPEYKEKRNELTELRDKFRTEKLNQVQYERMIKLEMDILKTQSEKWDDIYIKNYVKGNREKLAKFNAVQEKYLYDLSFVNSQIEVDMIRQREERAKPKVGAGNFFDPGATALKAKDNLIKPRFISGNVKLEENTGDDVFNLNKILQQKGVNTYSLPFDQQKKLKETEGFIGGLFSKSDVGKSLTSVRGTPAGNINMGSMVLADPSVNFQGLRSDVKDKFSKMATEYYDKTGKRVMINSAYRSMADQIKLHREKPNMAAKPGTSPHQFGVAIDANSGNLNEMNSMGLLNKYGFERKARTKSGELETWHTTPIGSSRTGAVEAGDDMSAKVPDYKVVMKYFKVTKDMVDGLDDMSKIIPNFQSQKVGKRVNEMLESKPKTTRTETSPEIKILSDIKNLLTKANQDNLKQKDEGSKIKSNIASSSPPPQSSYQSLDEILPNGAMLSILHNFVNSYAGGY